MQAPKLSTSRRLLLGGGTALGLLAAGGLVVRNQLSHPSRDKRSRPDGRFRRILIASPHPAHDPVLLVAERQGIFARYNLDVGLAEAASGPDALDLLHPGGADAAVAPALSWLPRLLGGLDAKLVCGLQSGSARLLVDPHGGIRRVEDLNHKTIGIVNAEAGPKASADRLFFSIMLRRKGIDPNQGITWLQLAPEQFGQALASRTVQAVVGHDPVIWQVREQQHLSELASSQTGSYSNRVSRVLGLRADLLRTDPEAAIALALAVQEAAAALSAHIDTVASLLADELTDLDEHQIERMLRAEGHGVHPVGQELREQIAQYLDELKLIGLADEALDSDRTARRFCDSVVHP